MRPTRSRVRSPIVLAAMAALLRVAGTAPAQEHQAAPDRPDLELAALQTAGPGLVGDCNRAVARLRNAGRAGTAEAPEVRLEVQGDSPWQQVARAPEPLASGATVEVWFERVPLGAGVLSLLQATADPDDRVAETDETNNTRGVHREPRTGCDEAAPTASSGMELRVHAVRASDERAALAGAEVTVTSPLGAGVVLARGTTGVDGGAVLALPADDRVQMLRVSATAAGCAPEAHVLSRTGAASPLVLELSLECAGDGDDGSGAGSGEPAPGTLLIEAALPGYLRLDEDPPRAVALGERVLESRPGARVQVRMMSPGGVLFHDSVVDVPVEEGRMMVIDAPPLQPLLADDVVEDLRSGLLWTVGARATSSFADAVATCDGLERGGATDWRLPEIDDLAFVLLARSADAAASALLPETSPCCLWSATEHSAWRLTFYVDGGHIYGRDPTERGVGALCVRGERHAADPLLVPERWRDRLTGHRRFAP